MTRKAREGGFWTGGTALIPAFGMMQANRKPDDDRELKKRRQSYELAATRVKIAGQRLRDAVRLQLRYGPDQARVPAGNPGGGEWTAAGESGRGTAQPTRQVAQGMGKQKFSGVLIRQNYIRTRDVSECTYYDSRANYRFTTTYP